MWSDSHWCTNSSADKKKLHYIMQRCCQTSPAEDEHSGTGKSVVPLHISLTENDIFYYELMMLFTS